MNSGGRFIIDLLHKSGNYIDREIFCHRFHEFSRILNRTYAKPGFIPLTLAPDASAGVFTNPR